MASDDLRVEDDHTKEWQKKKKNKVGMRGRGERVDSKSLNDEERD